MDAPEVIYIVFNYVQIKLLLKYFGYRCHKIDFKIITNGYKYLIFDKQYIFKPINGVSSNGIFKIEKNKPKYKSILVKI